MEFIVIKDNKVISSRHGKYIVDGEIINTEGLSVGMEFINGVWVTPIVTTENIPSNTEIAQMISDLQADLIIAGVIQ